MAEKRYLIGVIGAGVEDPETHRLAGEVGALIAEKGHILVNGGLGGVMEASARGCKENGGVTVGILPGQNPEEANPYIEIPLATGLGEMRNMLIIRASHGLIAVGGGLGTLSEIALALKAGKPVVGLKTWEVSEEIIRTEGPREAVEGVLKAIKGV